MNYRFIGLIAGLALTGGIVSCSATSTTPEATPATQSNPATKPADAMKNDAMKGDAMKDKSGDAMKNDAMKNDAMKSDAMKNDAMKSDAMKDGRPAESPKP